MENGLNSEKNHQGNGISVSKSGILEFISFIYKDLWEIGSSPAYKFELLKKNMLTSDNPRILDLGCGKGAELIQLYMKFKFDGIGVDIVPEFIEEANFRKGLNDAKPLRFEVDDFKANLDNYKDYDVVLFTHNEDVFGSVCETLNTIKKTVKQNGHICFDNWVRRSGASSPEAKNFHTFKEMKEGFDSCGYELCGYIFWDLNGIKRQNSFKMTCIDGRTSELKKQHPDKEELFNKFVEAHRKKVLLSETELDTLTWLLRVK